VLNSDACQRGKHPQADSSDTDRAERTRSEESLRSISGDSCRHTRKSAPAEHIGNACHLLTCEAAKSNVIG